MNRTKRFTLDFLLMFPGLFFLQFFPHRKRAAQLFTDADEGHAAEGVPEYGADFFDHAPPCFFCYYLIRYDVRMNNFPKNGAYFGARNAVGWIIGKCAVFGLSRNDTAVI